MVVDNETVNLSMWDTAGQEQFQSLCRAFYRGTDCCIIVYDVTDPKGFESLSKWQERFSEATSGADEVPYVLIGNKCDLPSKVSKAMVDKLWIDTGKAQAHILVTAKENTGTAEAFVMVARLALLELKKAEAA